MADLVTELRSGKHEQCRGRLKDWDGGHCCVGVLEEHVLHVPYRVHTQMGPESVVSGPYVPALNNSVSKYAKLHAIANEAECKILNRLAEARGFDSNMFDPANATRVGILAALNDKLALNFGEIALLIEGFGWNVQEYEEFMQDYEPPLLGKVID